MRTQGQGNIAKTWVLPKKERKSSIASTKASYGSMVLTCAKRKTTQERKKAYTSIGSLKAAKRRKYSYKTNSFYDQLQKLAKKETVRRSSQSI